MTETLAIKIALYTLKPEQIELLAEDFFGHSLTLAGEETIKETMELEFEDAFVENEKVKESGKGLAVSFLAALQCFQKPVDPPPPKKRGRKVK